MDVAHPIKAVIPSLDARVLEVMAGTLSSMSGLQVQSLVPEASYAGVRKVLLRLVSQGLVHADSRGNAVYFSANRKHLAWPAVETLVSLRQTLFGQLRESIAGWRPPPIHASLFGSAARGDGDETSDIDLLLVRPELAADAEAAWSGQVDALRGAVVQMTGNDLQIFETSLDDLRPLIEARDPIVDEWRRDGLPLAGRNLTSIVRELAKRD